MALTLNQAERRELITALVANCAGWDEDDISILANMSPEKLWAHAQGCAQMIANAETEDDSGIPDSLEPSSANDLESEAEDEGWEEENLEGEDGESGPEAGTDKTKKMDQPKRCHDDNGNEVDCPDKETTATGDNVQNEYNYLAQLPPRVRSVVLNAMKFEHAQKQQLVGQITANSRNRFSDSYLMRMGVEELQALAELATPQQRRPQPNYVGAAGGVTFNESYGVDRDDILVPPVLEFKRG
jgi:hypothetical protein